MDEWITRFGATASLMLAFAVGSLVSAVLAALALRQQRQMLQHGEVRLKKTLRQTVAQLEHARKNAEALQEEVQGWRQRASMWQGGRELAKPRVAVAEAAAPSSEPDAWVLGTHWDETPASGSKSPKRDFADTQVLPAYVQ